MHKKYCPKCKQPDKEFGINGSRPNGLQVWCKDCTKDYRQSRRHEKSVYNAQYWGTNSLSIKARHRKWRQANQQQQQRRYDAYFQTPRGRAAKLIREIKRRCKNSGMPCTITSANLIPALKVGYCEVTKLPFDFSGVSTPFVPSVDRINTQRGYEPDNIRIVVLMFNLARRNWRDDDVLTMARALVENCHEQSADLPVSHAFMETGKAQQEHLPA